MLKILSFFKKLIWFSFLGVVFGFFAVAGVASVVVWQLFYGDVSELKKNAILAKIQEETTLYYLDEKTTIGSIFESSHRRYVPIEEIPVHMLNALVASEDKNFYHHRGVDPVAIFKALVEGLGERGRFRRGGSTLTQQTIKNIVNDWELSFARKFRELIKSLQLERMYTKQQILEFYLNQFHVAGNGRGVGIAARYYFNKEVKELNLIESAFIAGSVKGPGKYNPFIKYTKEAQEKARIYANDRKNYVLDHMHEEGWIKDDEYKQALKTSVPFEKGEFRTAEVALVDLVKEQLTKKEILDAVGLTDPEDFNTSGFKVYTTLDSEFQIAAQLAMRRNLSRLETILQGFQTEPQEEFRVLRSLEKDSFVFAKVAAIEGKDAKTYQVQLNFGLPKGVIPNESLVRYAKLLDLVDGKGYIKHMEEIVKNLKIGDVLFVQVLSYDKDTHEVLAELQKRPKISGGLVALERGEVRSVISGFDTLGYNRAITAKRQAGSVFKALVFFSSLQLGWNILDKLDNVRQIFPYQGRFYYPRPDHDSPYESVSMVWAGVMSENLASVSLGARLVEKLNFSQFKKLMNFMGLLPTDGENPRDYHYRVARKLGVSLDNEGVKTFQLQHAINDVIPDLVFAGDQHILSKLRQMWWGQGYVSELLRIHALGRSPGWYNELHVRHSLVLNNFLRYEKVNESLLKDWEKIEKQIAQDGVEKAFLNPNLKPIFSRFHVVSNSDSSKPGLGYFTLVEGEEKVSMSSPLSVSESTGRSLNTMDIHSIWGGADLPASAVKAEIKVQDVRLAGFLPQRVFARLKDSVEKHYESVMSSTDPYQLSAYYQHHDFRISLGLNYIVQLSRACGIYNPLDPVLSFPLGTSDVTTSEVAKVFQTFISGKTYRFYETGPSNQLSFIRRIEDRFGHIVYKPEAKERQTVDPIFAYQMREILRKVVTHGTGRRAKGELYVTLDETSPNQVKIRVPAFGKTGTTNDFITSYFAGFLPYPVQGEKELDLDNSYVVASYVGYDNNKSMRRGRQRIYGGSGALPLWTDFLKDVIKIKKYSEKIDLLDLSVLSRKEWAVKRDEKKTQPFVVDLPRGIILRAGGGDEDSWSATNLASTGEGYQNEFALDSNLASIVYLPAGSRAGGRYFSLFNSNTEVEKVDEFSFLRTEDLSSELPPPNPALTGTEAP